MFSFYSGALDPWLEGLWKTLLELYPLPEGFQVTDEPQLWSPRIHIEIKDEVLTEECWDSGLSKVFFSIYKILKGIQLTFHMELLEILCSSNII